jgi:replicative superfamily II helicase
MIQDLSDKVWTNPHFQTAATKINRLWLQRELNFLPAETLDEKTAAKAMAAAAILVCSKEIERRRMAHHLAASAFDLLERSDLPLDAMLRVVLTRLGNFPSLATRDAVDSSLTQLPWTLTAEEIAARDANTITLNGRELWLTNFQLRLWNDLINNDSLALSAPTSAGKSFILQLFIASFRSKRTARVIYIVPTRALIAQVTRELDQIFKEHNIAQPEVITVPIRSDIAVPPEALFVMTQERVDLTLQAHPDLAADLAIVDEAHSISDGSRGILLQTVIEELLLRNAQTQVLFASPTTRNLDLYERLFGVSVNRRRSREPTVSQNFLLVKTNYPNPKSVTVETSTHSAVGQLSADFKLATRLERLAHVPFLLGHGHSNLIYANGADEAEEIAIRLSETLSSRDTTPQREALSALVKESVHDKYVLADCVKKGVGFHYGNIPTIVRQQVEAAFSVGDLDYLVCTSTLLQGVNLPAKNIFMLKPTKGQGTALNSTDFWNLSGRAGRLRKEFQGNIFLSTTSAGGTTF